MFTNELWVRKLMGLFFRVMLPYFLIVQLFIHKVHPETTHMKTSMSINRFAAKLSVRVEFKLDMIILLLKQLEVRTSRGSSIL